MPASMPMSPEEPAANPSPTTAVGPDGATRSISETVARRVWVAAGGRCTMCNRYLLTDDHTGAPVSIGQLAHIVGWTTSKGSPRGTDPLDVAERNDEANLMLLCYDQHRVIDHRTMWEVYSADTLRAMKRTHEQRIKQLTGLRDDDRTTVIRMVGNLHGTGVELSPQTVASTLLADGRYPDYTLLGVDEYEVDLRQLPGEPDGSPGYWEIGRAIVTERLARLAAHVGKENVRHLSVFAIARIPMLVTLGSLLDDTVPTVVHPKRRAGDEGWGWTPGAPDVDFEHRLLQEGTDPHQAAVLFSVSGTVDRGRLPATVGEGTTIYELRPAGVTPNRELIRTRESLDRFTRSWADLLAELEQRHPGLPAVDVFPAVPITAAVAIGRTPMRAVHPRLRIYDLPAGAETYHYAMETTR